MSGYSKNKRKPTVLVVSGVIETMTWTLGPITRRRYGIRRENDNPVFLHLIDEGHDGPTLKALRGAFCEAVGLSQENNGHTMLYADKLYEIRPPKKR